MLERVNIRMWRMAKGVPYGTLLWFDETKEVPELFKMGGDLPLDSGLDSEYLDSTVSVSGSQMRLEL